MSYANRQRKEGVSVRSERSGNINVLLPTSESAVACGSIMSVTWSQESPALCLARFMRTCARLGDATNASATTNSK